MAKSVQQLWGDCDSLWLFVPDHLLYRSNQEDPGRCACQCDGSQYGEGPVKVAGPVQDESGDCRSRNPCKIANEVLETCPSACGLRPRERLRDRPEIGSSSAERNHGQQEHGYAKDRPRGGR